MRVRAPSSFYRVSLKALVFDSSARLLVIQNVDGTWEVPGGGWEHGETLEQCLERELREELGVGLLRADTSTIIPCVGVVAAGRPAWLKLALAVELDSRDFSFDARTTGSQLVTRADFLELAMHRSDRCLQERADLLWSAARPAPNARR